MKKAILVLEDGTVIYGKGFGAVGETYGELVFNTAMTGYVESLTDPSYAGQILMSTYPLVGNYGVCIEDCESDSVKASGFVVKEVCKTPSNWRSQMNLDTFLKKNCVPGIEGVDTRKLTRKIREHGTMKSRIVVYEHDEPDSSALIQKTISQPSISEREVVDRVSTSNLKRFNGGFGPEITVIDCGIKNSIIGQLKERNVNVSLVPYDSTSCEILKTEPDAVLISNGPGDPSILDQTISTARELAGKVPLFGICLGHQIISLALGAKTYKLKFGHRGSNHPVIDCETGRVFITSQNHGFSVDRDSLEGTGLEITMLNPNDWTVEGVRHKELNIYSVQFHPEAGPGPHDTHNFFDNMMKIIDRNRSVSR
ncbi:glutamine-hydrolyzing carbamoyl-phosphate synthase small subunit [Methanolobus bombayensis]|uniref:glutamine-hydrolyzing carbamoyl-phosphate synthase small subunit n=1 Tax=Methanolobus bombayensis TaxID=38023 RepID=UPI001AE86075|nr:glutamine-hydrolyzing carbamoyl-phosphate synthase small subunit [Methanolobus bombayensis]MBP1908940.1 carbamoyl-phosphate synthase small subunit [Methanolobus bombayensis]